MRIYTGVDPGKMGIKKTSVEQRWLNTKILKNIKAGKIVVSLASNFITFRKIAVPVTDKKKVEEIIKEELSHSIPFFKDTVWDYAVAGNNSYFAAVALKADLNSVIAANRGRFDYIEAEPFALARSMIYAGHKNIVAVDMGKSKTVVCLIKNGYLNSVNVILKGGDSLTEYISKKFNISFEKAETEKMKLDYANPVIKEFLNQLFELMTLDFKEIDEIVLTGNASKLKGIDKAFSDFFNKETVFFDLPKGALSAVSLGCALKGTPLMEGVEFAVGKEKTTGVKLTPIIACLTALLILFTVNIKLSEWYYKNQYDMLNKSVKQLIDREFPARGSYFISDIKQIVADEKNIFQGRNCSALSVLNKLGEITNPSEIKFFEINYSNNICTLAGEASSMNYLKNFQEKGETLFASAEISEMKSDENGKINFVIKIKMTESLK